MKTPLKLTSPWGLYGFTADLFLGDAHHMYGEEKRVLPVRLSWNRSAP